MSEVHHNRFLIDASEFKRELEHEIARAQKRVLIQVMTFECDEAGNWLLDCVKQSPAQEKKLVVDGYSLVNINDGLALGSRYFFDSGFKAEVDATRQLLKKSHFEGIDIHVTNRMGWNAALYPFRNHKKLIVVDDSLYLGGLNFSDHNFFWHDFLVKISDPELVQSAVDDLASTISGRDQSKVVHFRNASLYFLNGRRSKPHYKSLFDLIKSAKSSIKIITPYLSNPLLNELRNVKVRVDILTPDLNNKGIMTKMLLGAAVGLEWNIHLYQKRMSHVKAILIDDDVLLLGSSNFDFVSYELEQEIVMVCREGEVIEEFLERVWRVDFANSRKHSSPQKRYLGARIAIFAAETFIRFLGLFKKA